MDLNDTELRLKKTNDNMNKSESAETDDTEAANAAQKMSAIQTKDEFYDALRIWVQQYQLQQMAYMCFPYYVSSNMPTPDGPSIHPSFLAASQRFTPFQQQTNPINLNNANQPNLITTPRSAEHIRMNMQFLYNHSGFEYVIAPVWKRFIAEALDVVILSVIKLMVIFMMIDLFNVKIVNLDFDTLRSSLEDDYLEFLTFSTDLLMVEILTKVLVCIYEAAWTAQGQTTIGGATPGKLLMGIRILYVEAVVPIGQVNVEANFFAPSQMRAIMYPATNPGFRRALMRAIAKNMLMTLMFPMCFVLLFFRNNRTGYDVMTKTIVVEGNPVPLRVRQ